MKIHDVFICLSIVNGCFAQSDRGGEDRRTESQTLEEAFRAYKKASNYERKIRLVIRFIEQLENISNNLKFFSDYSNLVGKLTGHNDSCSEKAQDAYSFLNNCGSTVPDLCSAPSISRVNASMCVNDKASSFIKFLKCANQKNVGLQNCFVENEPKFPQKCKNILNKLPQVKSAKSLCLNPLVSGSFSNCNNFIQNKIPSIIETCSGTSTQTEESKTVFVEGDEVIEQTESFDPIANELTLIVPSHGDREATTVIIGESSMVTSYEQYCVLGERPEDHINAVNDKSQSSKPSTFLNASTIETVYVFNVIGDEVNDNEKETLSDSFKNLCGGKPIKKSRSVTVDKNAFEKLNVFNESKIKKSLSTVTSRRKRSNMYTETRCAKTGTGCSFTFVTSTGSSIALSLRRHRVYATITCLACSNDLIQPKDLCNCSYIKDKLTYTECCKN